MASVTASGGVSDLRDRIEAAAQDESLDATDRYRLLAALRDELIDVLGAVDTYMATLNKLREAQAAEVTGGLVQAREIATLRETLIEQGIADAHELDEAGFLSHSDLDALEEEGLLLEAVGRLKGRWSELLHPRGRGGKFIDSPDHVDRYISPESLDPGLIDSVIHDPIGAMNAITDPSSVGAEPGNPVIGQIKQALKIADEESKQSWRKLPDSAMSARYVPEFSPPVAKLTGWQDTQDYLKGLGLTETDLKPVPDTDSETAPADFYRQIAQAVTDEVGRHPDIVKGESPLVGIRLLKPGDGAIDVMRSNPDLLKNAWAVTGNRDSLLTGDSTAEDKHGHFRKGPQLIGLNPYDALFDGAENVSEQIAAPTAVPYGRLTHELGHVVAGAHDLPAKATIQILDDFGMRPDIVAQVSPYGASNAPEAWAELYTVLHTPHGMDDLAPDIAAKVREFQQGYNKRVGETIL